MFGLVAAFGEVWLAWLSLQVRALLKLSSSFDHARAHTHMHTRALITAGPPWMQSLPALTPSQLQAAEMAGISLTTSGEFVCPQGKLSKRDVDGAMAQFSAFDIDGDGVVSWEDFHFAMTRHDPSLGHPSRRIQLEAMFKAVDVDDSGRVDAIDFLLMTLRKKQGGAPGRPQGGGGHDHQVDVPDDEAGDGGGVGGVTGALRYLDLRLIARVARQDRGLDPDIESGSESGSSEKSPCSPISSGRSYNSAQSSMTSNSNSDSGARSPIDGGSPSALRRPSLFARRGPSNLGSGRC